VQFGPQTPDRCRPKASPGGAVRFGRGHTERPGGVTALRSHGGGPALGAPAVNAPPLTHAGPTHEVELPSTHSAPTGATGSALGHRLSECGHDVTYGVRDPSDPKYQRLDTKRLPVKEAVAAADVVVIAIPWRAVEGLAGQLGDLGERVVIDATNPLAGPARKLRASPPAPKTSQRGPGAGML
jgi:hypothetical protein